MCVRARSRAVLAITPLGRPRQASGVRPSCATDAPKLCVSVRNHVAHTLAVCSVGGPTVSAAGVERTSDGACDHHERGRNRHLKQLDVDVPLAPCVRGIGFRVPRTKSNDCRLSARATFGMAAGEFQATGRGLAALGTHPQTLRIQLDSPSVTQSRRVAQNGSSLMGLHRSRSGCAFGYLGASGGPAVSQAAAPPSGLARYCFLSRAVHAQRISAVHPFNRNQVSARFPATGERDASAYLPSLKRHLLPPIATYYRHPPPLSTPFTRRTHTPAASHAAPLSGRPRGVRRIACGSFDDDLSRRQGSRTPRRVSHTRVGLVLDCDAIAAGAAYVGRASTRPADSGLVEISGRAAPARVGIGAHALLGRWAPLRK
ncbi:hypothetical protein HETIRDRAFT_387787 [Heterobasidion irregulare TC 32-1]|uniref:Uncharacterized protein n=1 Tax=Heterobasidion irregulare (strain TC 32-1) TaxID=747525 RepID=W4JXE2_HETIT|nr:uncharacterized protein HETIRDRAFT_387787 [Heterobasidion irregulare TC 32-1]ETW77740.1 hypothetical protein HETIRDRAFT_387787 [Heterobasidion irregulare TC 32-1]